MSKPWPPPPDIESIRELMREADPEGLIADGAPADEYEPEEDNFFAAIEHFPTSDMIAAKLTPILESVWSESFNLQAAALEERRPALEGLANQIERFFGPGAIPQVRGA